MSTPPTELEAALEELVHVPAEQRPKDEPTLRIFCTWCKTAFNTDPEIDDANFLKLHEGVCVNKTAEERAFYHLHRRWPRKPPPRELEQEVDKP